MRLTAYILCTFLILGLTGCGLMPKKVEYFQDKVQKMPEVTEKNKELQKQTAALASKKAKETLIVAIKEGCSTNVIDPAIDTSSLTEVLSASLGKPSALWTGRTDELLKKLSHEDAKYDSKLEDFRVDNNENAGKKIEGTGAIQLGYFTNLLILVVIFGVIYLAINVLKIVAQGTPYGGAVTIGTKAITGSAKIVGGLVSKGFTEVIEGGELFKKWVDAEFEDPETKEKIKEMFTSAQKEAQSRDTQDVIQKITN